MNAHVQELLGLIVRWVHLIAGIMWIGNSMLFNWLDRNLVQPDKPREGHLGEIWMLHSGGFYQVEKKFLPPNGLPKVLHWFKWQNGITWLSGIALLVLTYYLGGRAYMVDPAVADLSARAAVLLGVGTLVGSWLLYDLLWRSPLSEDVPLTFILSFLLVAVITYGLCHVLSGRAAYIHVGVMLGTWMTGNVWLHIMPSQKELVAATREGRAQDPALSYQAKQRSIHNNYMTFPLLFTMISNHFPSTYGNSLNWVVLGVLALSSAGVRHYMNIRFTYKNWVPPASGLLVAGAALTLYLMARPGAMGGAARPRTGREARVSYVTAQAVIHRRCQPCHSAAPTDHSVPAAPNGVMFDTAEQIQARAAMIKLRAVTTATMPQGNKTGMTADERYLLGLWIDQGARLE